MAVLDGAAGAVRDSVRAAAMFAMGTRDEFTRRMLGRHMIADPYPTYEWARSQGRLIGSKYGLTTVDWELANAILRNPAIRTANSQRGVVAEQLGGRVMGWMFGPPRRPGVVDPIGPDSMIGTDGEAHRRLRRLTREPFSATTIEQLRPRLTRVAEQLVREARRSPTFDLMEEFATRLPVTAICELLGIPEEDRGRFRAWGEAIAADLDAYVTAPRERAAGRAMRELQAYFTDLIPRRRADPGEDVLSHLIAAEEEDRLSERELLVLCSLLVLAGFETTVNLIGNGVMALIRFPEQQEVLRADPSLIPGAVDEFLRYDAPIQIVARFAPEDMEIAGVEIPATIPLSIMLGGANRDPAMFEDPATLDVTRANARKHLSFSTGPHNCLGAPLAVLEAEVAFAALFEALPELRLADRAQRRDTFVMRGYQRIPLVS
ncbi:MAG: cytochrome P450 [bacterium]|nr:cytochrome P450 [bacterium]